ncbi:MAG TPA: aminopeptidase [Saprospiraceae bacterium]|nr:aminopeptidase [Saprospiraceae bacterium]MCB9327939.1 aminopeptidase [Lewinellaceae bacterium]HPK09763.1 aminopeptidase [Saprospiraceae bacterium]HPQ20754.1 aminopeptidase [Saprospiraceae bacterium]
MSIISKYAQLLVDYCLYLKPGERLYIATTTAAEDLVKEVFRFATRRGALVDINMAFPDKNRIFLEEASQEQLSQNSPLLEYVMNNYEAYLVIRAPFNLREDQNVDKQKEKTKSLAAKPINDSYFRRTADGSMKRCLCQYPTQASAQEASMSLEEYQHFVFNACKLYEDDPRAAWEELGKNQQRIVDYLNQCNEIRYSNAKTDIKFSVKNRLWINSDGKNNMPSGEVFTGPIEDSVNGVVHFDYPAIYKGHDVQDITLWVENGEVVRWDASRGMDILNEVFSIEGARKFGEVAIGTNYGIQQSTKNILFDEKIGGSIHMAVGQSYIQTGGKNQSVVHWDMISNMKDGGEIHADGKLIYKDGKFLI